MTSLLPTIAFDLSASSARGRRLVFASVLLLVGITAEARGTITELIKPVLPAKAAVVPTANVAAERWAKYEPELQKFAEWDQANTPIKEGILFVGSSIFRHWTNVGEQMAPLPVLNRAFGGSRTGDQLARFDQVVRPYAPKLIVYYCGSNDINAGEMPAEILANFREFVARVHAALPQTHIIFASILRAPQKKAYWDLVNEANTLIQKFSTQDALVSFVDINPAVFDDHGAPRMELYREDKLHYLPPAYVEFSKIIKPVLVKEWAAVAH
jgi:lysophospholipase L1-like esterase